MYVKIKYFKYNSGTRIRAQPYFNIFMSAYWQLFHKPRRTVEGTARVELTTSLTIPERISGVKLVFKLLFTCSITEIVIADIWRDWYGYMVVDVSAGTQ